MTHEYDDPLNPTALNASTARVLMLRRSAPDEPLEKHIEQAIHEHICACAIDIEDRIEGARSGLHDAIANEVRRRVECALGASGEHSTPRDEVDRASDQSFPASDPPGWLWQRPDER